MNESLLSRVLPIRASVLLLLLRLVSERPSTPDAAPSPFQRVLGRVHLQSGGKEDKQ